MKTTASDRAQAFMDALQTLEQNNDPETLAALFTDDASLVRMTHKTYEGHDDIRRFWSEYLEPFDDLATEFFNVTEDDDGAVLEWETKGTLAGGKPIHYRGVSSLSYDGEGDKVKAFRTYYDSAAFLSEGSSR